MAIEQYTATVTDSDREVAVEYDFGDNLEDAVAKFGEEVVFTRFKSAAVIDLQSLIRRGIKAVNEDGTAKLTNEEIQASVLEWKPGIKNVSRKSKVDKVKDLLSNMSGADKDSILELLAAGDDETSKDALAD